MNGEKLIQISPMGNLGNRMIQYLAALSLASRVPGVGLAQVPLPEWGISIPPRPDDGARIAVVQAEQIPHDWLAEALDSGRIDRVDIRCYAQRLENFLAAGQYRDLFTVPGVTGTGPEEVLINIRQGDVLDGHHPDYVLVPIAFYAEVIAQLGLAPVFMGQIEDSPYLRALRRSFPRARFMPSQGALRDFAFIRASRVIVPSVSTFSWLAAWLSGADRIVLPVLGLYHPLQSLSTNLLPLADPRYRFALFPFNYAVPVEDFARSHAALHGSWRFMPGRELALALDRASARRRHHAERGRSRDIRLAVFDEAFYLDAYPDIASAVLAGSVAGGRAHYEVSGLAEGRDPCLVRRAWYCRTYPSAAIELGQGEALDVFDHWATIGRGLGYEPPFAQAAAPAGTMAR